ncbi:DEAD/DEAH box helicase [Immundisolibacter sp.]|uniref:DEAD/DEAH box helicase n=1 Tax=Immundisolibacter sp. TaxID=1934948 RepID=UPI002B10C0BE|nr:DEAD/DEAH box helicase [Immundisolibacter sp.]MEA3220903.1 ATP-dependent RNA helicase SrmB [Immundisolibacter sp.]
MPLADFHPAVAAWFGQAFSAPTAAQLGAWPAIRSGQHTLLAAPTGSGKTLAAFLTAIDDLVRAGLAGPLPDAVQVLYVSPLRALSADIQRNLEAPLAGIRDQLLLHGLSDVPIRTGVRTGDTPQAERVRQRRQVPHILVTTPESLYILLTSKSGRAMLGGVRTVIVDEIHALAANKRGAHLMLSLERLSALTDRPPQRVGLSATQKPIGRLADYLVSAGGACTVIDTGHGRERDLAIEVTDSPLTAVMANEVWTEVYDRLAALVAEHRTTLVFVNTRRLAERAARHLAERLGEEFVTAHHGSLARRHRLDAEQRLKAGQLKALVCTASLELGIDIGDVDLVCQLGSPKSIATFLQRVGRSGHAVGGLPKGRLFPLSRDDLVECAALLDAVRRGELDAIVMPQAPLDVLAQQIVAEVSAREWDERMLFDAFRAAAPYRQLDRADFTAVVKMLAEGYTTRRGRRGAWLHRDGVHGRLRARRGAALAAVTSGGVIPDQFDCDVLLTPEALRIGSVNEDFAFESLPGDIFQLGNTSYRILKVETGRLFVEDAHGQPPNIPFWFGEAPGRTLELSSAVSRLRADISAWLDEGGMPLAQARLEAQLPVPPAAARQLIEYLAAARAALGALPTQEMVIFERFFDETGDQHLVIHAPFGSRVNKAWGLALRKRFCRRFNFELQAAALEDSIVISLGSVHSFPLHEPAGYLHSASAREVLIQAVIAAPLFEARWRWVATAALAILRQRAGRRTPPQWQRSDAQDLVAAVFPDQIACAENLHAERSVPDHPLVRQAIADCLTESMDVGGFLAVLAGIEGGAIRILTRDLTAPSPLAEEILNARPYAFLDDVPAEERRTLAVRPGPTDMASAATLGVLQQDAIDRVRAEAWPQARGADELHNALLLLGFVTTAEAAREIGWADGLAALALDGRATCLDGALWVAAERLGEVRAVLPDAVANPPVAAIADGPPPAAEDALRELLRGRLEGLGPVTSPQLAAPLGLPLTCIEAALLALEGEGFVLRGRYTPGTRDEEWCERGLLARIHRYSLDRRRREIAPVSEADYARFLRRWQGLDEPLEGPEALYAVIEQLEGLSHPAAAWEGQILPARLAGYLPFWLDQLCAEGRVAWLRLLPPRLSRERPRAVTPVRSTPIVLVPREHLAFWRVLAPTPPVAAELSSPAGRVRDALTELGASFFAELVAATGLLRTQVESALAELVALGMVTSDSFSGLRTLIAPASQRPSFAPRRYRSPRARVAGVGAAGRWSLLPTLADADPRTRDAAIEHVAHTLLARHGIVFRAALEAENCAPPWRELLYVYRRLEARGELRGGRFVQRFAGEQYAAPEALAMLRSARIGTPAGGGAEADAQPA